MDKKQFELLLKALGKGEDQKVEEKTPPKSPAEIKDRLGKILYSIATEGSSGDSGQ